MRLRSDTATTILLCSSCPPEVYTFPIASISIIFLFWVIGKPAFLSTSFKDFCNVSKHPILPQRSTPGSPVNVAVGVRLGVKEIVGVMVGVGVATGVDVRVGVGAESSHEYTINGHHNYSHDIG